MPIYPAIIVLGLLVAGLVVFAVVRVSKRQEERLDSLATGLGMEVAKGRWWEQPTLHGEYGGKRIAIKNIYHSTGKSGYYTYKVSYLTNATSPANVFVNISRFGPVSWFFINIARAFGMKVVDFDDSEFKSSAVVKSKDEPFALSLIDMEIQQGIKNLRKGSIDIKGNEIIYEAFGMVQDNEEHVHNVLRFMEQLGRKLEYVTGKRSSSFDESGLARF